LRERAVALATLMAALLAGCGDGSSGRQKDTFATVPTTTNDNSWSTFEADVAAFGFALSEWRASVDECLSGTSVISCVKGAKHELERAYDAFRTGASRWLERPRLSFACSSNAFDVVTPLVQIYALFVTASSNPQSGTYDFSDTLDLAETYAAEEERSLNKARSSCAPATS
jgi:hypothetical protein